MQDAAIRFPCILCVKLDVLCPVTIHSFPSYCTFSGELDVLFPITVHSVVS